MQRFTVTVLKGGVCTRSGSVLSGSFEVTDEGDVFRTTSGQAIDKNIKTDPNITISPLTHP